MINSVVFLDRRKHKKIYKVLFRVWNPLNYAKPYKRISVLKRFFKQNAELFNNESCMLIFTTNITGRLKHRNIGITPITVEVIFKKMTDDEQNELAEINPVFYKFDVEQICEGGPWQGGPFEWLGFPSLRQ